ncbi:hypothetical protein Tco_0563600 [Tanacetum coccineum]
MKKIIPSMVDKRVNKIAKKLIPLYVAEGLLLDMQKTQIDLAALVVDAVNKERENLRVELSMHVTNDVANTVPSLGESSSEQVMDESNPYRSGTQEQLDEFDAWMDDFVTDDNEVPFEEVSPELLGRNIRGI